MRFHIENEVAACVITALSRHAECSSASLILPVWVVVLWGLLFNYLSVASHCLSVMLKIARSPS